MDQIIRDLYHGNLEAIIGTHRPQSCERIRALDTVTRLEAELEKRLPGDLIPKLKKYSAACSELACVGYEEEFLSGYRIGIRMMLAGLSGWPPSDRGSAAE